MHRTLIDISRTISSDATVWPGEESLRHSPLSAIGPGCPCQTTRLDGWSTHFLTHLDAPAHFIAGAPTLDQLPLSRFICAVTVIDIGDDAAMVEAHHVTADINSGEGVLFKTRNSNLVAEGKFIDDFVCLSLAAAKTLVARGVTLVGVDYLSVDPVASTDFPVHYELLGNNVLILEGTCLKDVAPRKYDLYALPLKIRGADGSPVRAILVKK